MGTLILFAFILFVMGGVAAYVGDRLGSYIGKKRHSSFGLRPRHTAMLWTVVSGGVIAVGTLLLFLLWDREFSAAVTRGPQLLVTNGLLEHQNYALTRRNAATEAQALANDQKAAAASAQAGRAEATLTGTLGDLSRARTALTISQSLLAQRQAQLSDAQAKLGLTRHDLGTAQAGVRQAQRQLSAATNQVARAQTVVLQLSSQRDHLGERNRLLAQENTRQQTRLVSAEGRKVIYRKGEEIGRTVVSASQTPEGIRRLLAGFLEDLAKQAQQRGALRSNLAPAILVAGPRALVPAVNTMAAALDSLSQSISAQSESVPSVVVIANARYNTFGGEQVVLELHPYDNTLVFANGAEIASTVIDGAQPEDIILKQLEQFLIARVRPAALHEGIIPLHDPQSGEPLVGQPIESSKWVALVKQIQQIGPGARVTAVATGDTYSGDLLHLELLVAAPPLAPAASAATQAGAG